METADIKALLEQADVAGDGYRWKAAQAISEALAGGMSQRTLAKEIGRSNFFVSTYARTWEEFGSVSTANTLTFTEAITKVRAATPKPRKLTPLQSSLKSGGALKEFNQRVTRMIKSISGLTLEDQQRVNQDLQETTLLLTKLAQEIQKGNSIHV